VTALTWATASLQRALQPLLPGLQVQAVASVDSTSTRLVERLRGGEAAPRLLVAEMQTAGRGRNGRRWTSAPGASLTFSLGLPFAPVDWSGLSLAVGVALADAIEPQPARLMLKWPNDLWLADAPGSSRWRKLGGILIETVVAGESRACVLGIGLNVLPRADVQDLASGYACVQELDDTLDAPALLAGVAPALVAALQRFEREGLAPFADAFARRDLLRGQSVSTTLASVPIGVAEGVDAQGALCVRHAGGVTAVSSGEVSVRPGLPSAAPPVAAGT
jgi:BirA family transcriptional regulator, biotin operon repressor / biotin---[acetyl-CoA-carboxylase] ligase